MQNQEKVGVIAGRGRFPLLFCQAARKHGVKQICVVAMKEETDPAIEELADHTTWLYVGQLGKAIRALKQDGVNGAVMAGQIRPQRLFGGLRPDWRALKLLNALRKKNADTIFSAVAAEFEHDGITILPSLTFMDESMATPGVMGRIKPDTATRNDIELGWRIAREVSRLDIGQAVVVKGGTILAVEGFEGTDQTIRRGGELGRGGVTVVKVAKPGHDIRFDVPCIGLETVESLVRARARALAVQAGMTLFLDYEKVLERLNAEKIAVVGLELPHGAKENQQEPSP